MTTEVHHGTAPQAQLRDSQLVSISVLQILRFQTASGTKGEALLQRYPKARRKGSRVAGQEELWLWVRSGLILTSPVTALGTQSSLCLVSLSLWEILVLSKERSRKTLGLRLSPWCHRATVSLSALNYDMCAHTCCAYMTCVLTPAMPTKRKLGESMKRSTQMWP